MTNTQLEKIKKFASRKMKDSLDPQHDFSHVDRVRKNALKIVKILKVDDKIDINLLQAMCLLHDITFTKYSPSLSTYLFEGILAEKVLSNILNKFELGIEEKSKITQAIVHHPLAFPLKNLNRNRDLYTKILQDADTLDQFSPERLRSLQKAKEKYFHYKIISGIGGAVYRYCRKNIKKFLNLPKIAKSFYE